MKYKMTCLREELSIHNIISIHYFEYMSDFSFAGESHNFWELLCVDKGEVDIVADFDRMTLRKGDIIFHQPNEFHKVLGNGKIAPNLVVIGFECQSPGMEFFRERVLTVEEEDQNLLAQIIAEARQCFDGRRDDPYQEVLVRRKDAPFGGEQMIKIHLEQFLIQIFRRAHAALKRHDVKPAALKDSTSSEEMYRGILAYFDKNIRCQLTIGQISRDNLISISQLKKLFLEMSESGVMEHFNQMKIEAAKQLIRNRQFNFTQIASYLGYNSIHYFSRQFKHLTGMTPSEYSTSIKKLAEKSIKREEEI